MIRSQLDSRKTSLFTPVSVKCLELTTYVPILLLSTSLLRGGPCILFLVWTKAKASRTSICVRAIPTVQITPTTYIYAPPYSFNHLPKQPPRPALMIYFLSHQNTLTLQEICSQMCPRPAVWLIGSQFVSEAVFLVLSSHDQITEMHVNARCEQGLGQHKMMRLHKMNISKKKYIFIILLKIGKRSYKALCCHVK